MMRHFKIKHFLLLSSLLLTFVICDARGVISNDGYSNIVIKINNVQGVPKDTSIQASINGHLLSVVFFENLGQVTVEVSYAVGGEVETTAMGTPNGVNFYIPTAGSYIIYFTLENGDVYYGEFEVTD